MKYIITLFCVVLFFANTIFSQQSILLTHQAQMPYITNPAAAGFKDYIPIRLLSRSQWVGFNNKSPKTQLLYGHGHNGNYGIGLMFMNDQYGNTRNSYAQLSYAYRIPLNENGLKLALGLSAKFHQFAINQTDYVYFNHNDNLISEGKENTTVPDFDFGMMMYNNNFYFGLSTLSMLEPQINLGTATSENNKLQRQVYLSGGYSYDLSDSYQLEPSLLLNYNQESSVMLDLAIKNIINKNYWFSLSYKTIGLMGIMAGLNLKKYSLGYAYEYTTGNISNYTNGTHEIYLGMNIDLKKD